MQARYLGAPLIVAGLALVISAPAGEAPSKEKIDHLIEQLGSDSFRERDKATRELAAIGVPALQALRKAAQSDDAEVRKRAGNLLPNIELQARSKGILTSRRVHLAYKDTPLSEAIADFQKQSGYTLHLHDPDDKLKERKITLDTEETTFWHALALFCDKAQLSEGSVEDLMRARQRPGDAPSAVPWWPRTGQELILKEGKAKKVPTDNRRAIRIQAMARADLPGNFYEGEITLPLEVSLEPKLTWNSTQAWKRPFPSIRIDKAVDDQGQHLSKVIPRIEGAVGLDASSNPPRIRKIDSQVAQQMSMKPFPPRSKSGGSGLTQVVILQIRKGVKEARALKELKGVLMMHLYSEVQPVIVADELNKAASKTFKGDGGSSIKIVSVASEEEQTTIKLEHEQGDIRPLRRDLTAGEALALSASGQFTYTIYDLCIQDDKGKSLRIDGSRSQGIISMAKNGNDKLRKITTCTLVCPHDKDRGKPARIVYLGRIPVTVEVPFALEDVPLP